MSWGKKSYTRSSSHSCITVPRLFSVVSRHCFVPIAGVVRETYSFGALSANHVFLSQPMRVENSSHVISQLQRTCLFNELRWWTTWSSHVIYQLQESRLAVWRASLMNHVTGNRSGSVQTCMLNEPQQITWWKSRGRVAELLLVQCVNEVTCPSKEPVRKGLWLAVSDHVP